MEAIFTQGISDLVVCLGCSLSY